MGFFTRDRAEKVVEYHHYPEPWLVARSKLFSFWWRFWLGRPLDGVRWTNSTFFHSASRGEASWWLRLAGWQRAAYRALGLWLLIVLPILLLLWAVGAHSILLRVLLLHLVAATLPLLLLDRHFRREHGVRLPVPRRLEIEVPVATEVLEGEVLPAEPEQRWRFQWELEWQWVREGAREWERSKVRPLAAAIAESLDNVYRPGDTDWVRVPRNYMEHGGAPVTIMLPTTFGGDPASIKRLERVISNKLGMKDPTFQWQLAGDAPRVLASAPPVPPEEAPFAQYEELMLATQEYSPFLGVVASGELTSAEMIDASPHIGLSAGTGAGKSMLLRSIIMQALRWGWFVIILDWKAESHEWAEGLPGVRILTDIEDIHDMGERIGQEVDIRKKLSKEERARRPRTLVVREEWNITATLLWEYWAAQRSMATPEEKRLMPVRSPALMGFNALDFAGRAFGMFDLLVAQRMSNRVFNGNTDLRENFMIRLLARYTPQTWKMLIPEMKPIRKPDVLGRWVVWAKDEVQIVQALLISEDEAREFAMGGIPNPPSPFAAIPDADGVVTSSHRVNVDTELGDQLRHVATSHHAEAAALTDQPAPIILRKLVDISTTLEYLGITINILRKAARDDGQGDKRFPPVRGGTQFSGYLYDVAEVTEWARNYRARQAAEKEVRG